VGSAATTKAKRSVSHIMFARGKKNRNWLRQLICLGFCHAVFLAVVVAFCAIGAYGNAIAGVVLSSVIPFLLLTGGWIAFTETHFCTSEWAGGLIAFVGGSAMVAAGVTAGVRLATWDVFENSQLVRNAQFDDMTSASAAVAWTFKESTAKIAFSEDLPDSGSKMFMELRCGHEVSLNRILYPPPATDPSI
jgi:hypothetical protein